MVDTPKSENFYGLSLVADRFLQEAAQALVFEVGKLAQGGYREIDVPDIAASCAQLIRAKHNEIASAECKSTQSWLEAEPAFAMAFKSVGYTKIEDSFWETTFALQLERWLPKLREGNLSASYVALKLARQPYHYMNYVSLIAAASHRYISGIGHRVAIQGPSTVRRLKDLVTEFEQVINAEWLPHDLRRSLSHCLRTKSALSYLDSWEQEITPASHRNDVDLPTRLFATDLLRANQFLFQSFHKKAVFHLMGLSFVERPLEMRTIERLAKSETDAHRVIVAKRIAVKRGLDFDHVLTTLKANKSFAFPRENSE